MNNPGKQYVYILQNKFESLIVSNFSDIPSNSHISKQLLRGLAHALFFKTHDELVKHSR